MPAFLLTVCMTKNNPDNPHIDIDSALDVILPQVSKPARYIGGEPNSARKHLEDTDVSFALAFPDVYEIGMSNLGLRILYHVLNQDHEVSAERVFSPAEDMEILMREHNVPLFALESRRYVRDFDILGFSLSYELSYTAVLNMLDLAGIAVYSKDRTDTEPIVIAGGHCAANPKPMAEFIDAFVIGDGEDVVLELVKAFREANGDRTSAIEKMSHIAGVYVPAIHGVKDIQVHISHRAVASLELAPYPETLIVPHTEAVHDRVILEIMRGCSRGCRFCQAGMLTRPVRERSVKTLCRQAEQLLRQTGYDEIALSSLSSADHSRIGELVSTIIDKYESERVGVSLPSLRADAGCVKLAAEIQRVRKSGLTFAPEAGTQRLRDVVNKNVTEADLLDAVAAAVDNGWQRLKLYFMIGLPTETDEDITGIADLVRAVLNTSRSHGVKLALSVTVSPFVPKPHTPFQWHGMPQSEELDRRVALLRSMLNIKGVMLNWHEPAQSCVEASLARGGDEVSKAIFGAWKLGANLGQSRFNPDLWNKAFTEAGLNIADYANREYSEKEALPWDFVNAGVSKEFLVRENHKAFEGIVTPDCRTGECAGCGIRTPDNSQVCPPKAPEPGIAEIPQLPPKSDGPETLTIFRFSKTGRAKWLGHLDLVRAFDRAVRISGIDVVYSEGFNPRPRVALLSALSLGATASAEVVAIRLRLGDDFIGVINRLNVSLPEGLKVYDVNTIRDTFKPPAVTAGEFSLHVEVPDSCSATDIRKAIDGIMAKESILVRREKKNNVKTVDLRKGIMTLELNEEIANGCCEIKTVVAHGEYTPRPSEIAEIVGQDIPGLQLTAVHRNRVILR